MNKRLHRNFLVSALAISISSIFCSQSGWAQQEQAQARPQESSHADTLREVQKEMQDLRTVLKETREEASQSRREVEDLRNELQQAKEQLELLRKGLDAARQDAASTPDIRATQPKGPSGSTVEERVGKLVEDQQLLKSEVNDQSQTKVESAGKYRVRLSGIALLNVFSNRGKVDNEDVPSLALSRGPLDPSGDFGATVRQTELGLEVFGPELAGAQTSGQVQFDFFGGFPQTANGATTGIVRMRTANFRLDWSHTSVVMGQDAPFFSPLSPTTVASLGTPSFAYAGNLWTWTPQIHVERRIAVGDDSGIRVEGGILDPLSGEPPDFQFYRTPQPGESSRQPAYATRLAWEGQSFHQPISLGIGGYYSRQQYGLNRNVDAWAGTADWSVPVGPLFSLTGEFYRGQALGGLGGGLGRSAVFSGPLADPKSAVAGLDTEGGWGQLKFRPSEKIEFNAAYGQDNPFARDIRRFPSAQGYLYATLARNQSEFFNAIYRPRSDLLFSIEYRKIKTRDIAGNLKSADHINLGAGILF
jgi:hypothetical protein